MRDLFLTDGGIETVLIFHEGLDLPAFAAFDAARRTRRARRRCAATTRRTLALAAARGLGLRGREPDLARLARAGRARSATGRDELAALQPARDRADGGAGGYEARHAGRDQRLRRAVATTATTRPSC